MNIRSAVQISIGIFCLSALAAGPASQPGGPTPDLARMLPRLKPLAPAEALKSFKIEEGFRVELVAAEPMITDPVAIEWDENGRLYVCELWNYPLIPKKGDPLGRIRLLEDTDGDGRFDKSILFAENVTWPGGIACWDGGVFVISSPDLLYLKDTDGDGKADARKVVVTGFRGKSYQIPNCLRWGPDNQIYGAGSYAGGSLKAVGAGASTRPVDIGSGRDFRFDPRTGVVEAVAGSGEFGNCFDDWGNRFTCNAGTLIFYAPIPRQYLARNPYLGVPQVQENIFMGGNRIYSISEPEPWRVVREKLWSRWVDSEPNMRAGRFPPTELAPRGFLTSCAGVTVYRGSAYPEAYRGNAFTGEPANNVVVRMKLAPNGASISATRAEPQAKREFLMSTDPWFRPVNFANGPDGCLYVIDIYRETIEDDSAIPQEIMAHLDFNSGRDMGRIYRIVPDGFKPGPRPRLGKATVEQLVLSLENPDAWWRETAQRLLFERQDRSAVEPLRKLLRQSKSPQSRLHALWTLDGLGAIDEATAALALVDADAHVREHALRLAEPLVATSEAVRAKVIALAEDPEPRVRFQTALTLSAIGDARVTAALASIARKDLGDKWARSAILLASAQRAGALFDALARDREFAARPEGREIIGQLAHIVGGRNDPAEVSAVITTLLEEQSKEFRTGALRQLAEALARGGSSLPVALRRSTADPDAKLSRLFEDIRAAAGDLRTPDQQRVEAIGALAYAPAEVSRPALEALVAPAQPQAIQVAAVRALAMDADAAVARVLVSKWRTAGSAVRVELAEALLRRPERVAALLDAMESGKVPPRELDQRQRQALMRHGEEAIRRRAEKLLGRVSADRQAVIDQYRASVLKLRGDEARGAVVFETNCAICHRPGEGGRNVGPRLGELQDRSPDTVLINVLDPNREVKPDFVNYLLVTRDRQEISGVVTTETGNSVTVLRAGGVQDTVLRSSIKSLRSTGLSMMPEGLESGIDAQQMADLIRFLQTYKD